MLVTRNRFVATAIILTLGASIALSLVFHSGQHAVIVSLGRIIALTAFDLAIAWAVAKVAFGDGKVNVHRIMGALILYPVDRPGVRQRLQRLRAGRSIHRFPA